MGLYKKNGGIKMKKKLLTLAMAAVMTVSSALSAFSATESELTVEGFITSSTTPEKVSGDFDVTYEFHNETTGTSNWNNFIVEVKTADDQKDGVTMRADRCGWGFGEYADDLGGEWGPDIVWTDVAGYNWDTFATEMKDADCEVNIKRVGDVITFTYNVVTAAGGDYELVATLPAIAGLEDELQVTLTGELVKLTEITFTDNLAAVDDEPTTDAPTVDSPEADDPEIDPDEPTTDTPVEPEEPSTGDPDVDSPETDDPEVDDPVYDCTGRYVNLALVVDISGSMGSYIERVKENLIEVIREIEKSGAIARISLILYSDITVEGEDSTISETPDYSVWFDDVEMMVEEIENIELLFGGDGPETLVDGLGFVVNDDVMTWNAAAAKFAFVLTDADYKVDNIWGYESMSEVIDLLKAKDIQTTVVSNSYYEDYYADLYEGTGGIFINISEDFSAQLIDYAKKIIATTAEKEVDDTYVPVTGIELGDDVSAATDGIYQFPIKVTPDNATVKDIIWSVEDESIATINKELTNSEYCVVNMIKEGETKLIAKTLDGGYTAYFTLTVKDVVIGEDGSAETAKVEKVAETLADEKVDKVTVKGEKDSDAVVDADILKDIFTKLEELKNGTTIPSLEY